MEGGDFPNKGSAEQRLVWGGRSGLSCRPLQKGEAGYLGWLLGRISETTFVQSEACPVFPKGMV